jgi:hypothetical protein
MLKNRYLSVLFIMLFCADGNVFADTAAPVTKQRLPIECTDSVNYDQTDCAKALELRQWVKNQENIPDNKRLLIATVGDDILVEKETGYRIGPHKVKIGNILEPSIAVKIGTPSAAQMFVISGVCDIGNGVEVIQNTIDFTLFRKRCASTDRRLKADDGGDLFYYYNFDKHHKRLDVVFQAVSQQVKEPTQTFSNGLYKLFWRNYNNGNGKPFSMYFDYKITGNRADDLKCIRAWNEDVGCNFDMLSPLVSGKYKVIDE